MTNFLNTLFHPVFWIVGFTVGFTRLVKASYRAHKLATQLGYTKEQANEYAHRMVAREQDRLNQDYCS